MKYASPAMIHQNTPEGRRPSITDSQWVGGNPPGDTVYGMIRIACRAGVPGSALQVFTHACDWAED